MNKNDLRIKEALTDVQPEYVESAAKAEKKSGGYTFHLNAWEKGILAACLVIVLTVGILTMPGMITPVLAAESTPKPIDIDNDYAEPHIKYYSTGDHMVNYYGKLGYEWYISHEHPELDGYPEIITPDVFGEIDNLRNAVFSYHMNDYTFVAEDGTKYHVNIAYHAWSAFQLDNNDKTIDWHDKATDALIKMIKDSFDYDTKKPEVIEYDPSLFSEDLNYCYKDSAVTFVTADGDLMYSYVNGKLSCIWFYACDTLYEIYINFDENFDATGTSEWIQSLEGWLSDLASVETAPKAAAKLRQIAEDSWQIRYDYIHSLPEWEEDYIALRKPRDWYKKSEE